MTPTDVYIDGRRVELGKRIGKGGEGDVYNVVSAGSAAVKIYHKDKRADREEKVRAIVARSLAERTRLVAFPQAIVTTKSGSFLGFSMRLVAGFHEIHDLYGPKSRKRQFPKADFRFLVRTATNVACAVGEVHSTGSVIGDVNSKGILVGSDARVALIDADSFQIQAGGRTLPCLVGVPEFTPPELQGKTFGTVLRSKEHDQFGLALAIFQLLFLGRHPYAGQQSGGADLTLDQLIARNQFAYSRVRSVGASPPGTMATLEDFPADTAEAFEKSFGLVPAQRPSALEWIGLLKNLENRLSRCSADGMHFYPSAAKVCPWCRMERATGAILFPAPLSTVAGQGASIAGFDVEKAWMVIKAIVIPDPKTILPKLPVFPNQPSAEALAAKRGKFGDKALGALLAFGAIAMFVQMPTGWFLWIIGLACAVGLFNRSGVDAPHWRDRYSSADQRWQSRFETWRKATGIDEVAGLRSNLESAIQEFRGLGGAKSKAIMRLKSERHARQLNEYLDRFLIRRASIQGIGPAKTTTLASFGIETAADVTKPSVMRISGFGSSTAEKLLAWRAAYEKRFTYNPAPNARDKQAELEIEAEFASKTANLAKQIAGGQAELVDAARALNAKLTHENAELVELAGERAQLQVDLKYLGLSLPGKRHPIPTVSSYPSRPTPTRPKTQPGGVLCPRCGSRMIRRTARRGYNAGGQFWGCSRYPNCRGTRR